MRTPIAVAILICASVARAAGTPPASCPIGSNWTQTWTRTDPAYGTVLQYTISAPCHVLFNEDFTVTVHVVDPLCVLLQADNTLRASGFKWNVSDTDLTTNLTTRIAGAGVGGVSSFAQITTDSLSPEGEWVRNVTQHYGPGGTPADHRIAFTFTPRVVDDCYLPGMGWSATVIGTTTYDPYPASTVDPTPPASTDPIPPASTDPVPPASTDPVPPASTDPVPPASTDPVPPASTDPGAPGSMDGEGPTSGGETGGDQAGRGGTSTPAPSGTTATTVAESGGCGSAGVTPALLGFAALALAAFPRRRRPR